MVWIWSASVRSSPHRFLGSGWQFQVYVSPKERCQKREIPFPARECGAKLQTGRVVSQDSP